MSESARSGAPVLSVLVPAYNGARTIEQCLRSIRQSAFREYELVVIDDGSTDATARLAEPLADAVIRQKERLGLGESHQRGFSLARGAIIVNIDQDVLVRPETLGLISDYLARHTDVCAVCGMLAEEHPNKNFASQYKNLYMHYRFSRLPAEVTFLYGSIFALRREAVATLRFDWRFGVAFTDDTYMGQQLVSGGRKIAFLPSLEVVHLKRYTVASLLRNDFKIPSVWARLFITFRGWRQLGRYHLGFCHASLAQLVSVLSAPVIILLALLLREIILIGPLLVFWSILNGRFLFYLFKKKGFWFAAQAVLVTFLDQCVMIGGVMFGFLRTAALR